jgi:hypothetical protein
VLFFVIPPAIFLVTITVVGVPIAFVMGLMHLAFGVIAVVFTGIAEGSLLLHLTQKKETYEVSWKAALIGIPLAFLISIVPVAGFLANLVFFLVVFGALYQRFWLSFRAAT